MKDFGKLFPRRYSAVNAHDDETQQHLATGPVIGQNATVAGQRAVPFEKQQQRRKSLNPNCNMKPMDVLSTFFNERHNKDSARTPKCAFLFLAIGVLAITTAVLVKIFKPYDMIFNWKLIMVENGEIFNLWAKPPVDLYIKVYLFNITNAEEFLAGREQMRVEQVGPYVYKELMTHENVTFNENSTMSTNPSHPLIWQEHLSEGNREDDEVIMLNIAMLAIAHLTAPKPFLMRLALKSLFVTSKSQPIVRMTAREFMFGFPSSLTTLGNTFLPNWIPFEKVGLIDRMYDFSTDFETFYTGVKNPALSGLYATYRGETNLPQWKQEHCSNIEYASDGTKFKSFLQDNETIKFFRKSMCRPINLYRTGEQRTFGSLKGYNYVFEENAFDNGAINEANKCFCRKGNCQPVGLIDVTDCYYGFPISLSYPHFMHGNAGLVTNVSGMEPNPKKHSSAFVIQPESGLPLSLSVKVQINMHFKDLSTFQQVAVFSHLTAPMLWFEIMMPQLPESLDKRFNFYLNILPLLDPIGFWGGLILGIVLLAYTVTRATLHMSSYARQATNIYEGKYSRANLLQNLTSHHGRNNVYNPCELKLLEMNEKPLKNHVITRSSEQLYSKCRRQSAFALELEPTISEDGNSSSDEGNESETVTLRCNSSSSSCMAVENCADFFDDLVIQEQERNAGNDNNNQLSNGAKMQLTISFSSSGFGSNTPSSKSSSRTNISGDDITRGSTTELLNE